MKPIKIFMADDHVLLRDALAGTINSFPECEVVGVAANGEGVIASLQKDDLPDILLLDLNMPGMDGYETAKWLKANHPGIKVLVLSMFDSEIAMIRLMQSGVRGFMKKDISTENLRDAIHSVNVNGYYYCNSTTGKLAAFFNRDSNSHSAFEKGFISDTEIELLKLSATDLAYKEMAAPLGLTPRQVDALRDVLFAKLEVKNRQGLVMFAVKNGIVSF